MSIISDILNEEFKRLLALKKHYLSEIEKLPKGSLSKKKRRNNYYFYLAFRDKDKIIFQYVGKEGSEKVEMLRNLIIRRNEVKNKLKMINKNLNEIKKKTNVNE